MPVEVTAVRTPLGGHQPPLSHSTGEAQGRELVAETAVGVLRVILRVGYGRPSSPSPHCPVDEVLE